MSKQIINIGTGYDTGDGDKIRDAFDKANDNFTEVYELQGPFNGSKAANFELRQAVKSLQINLIRQQEMIYISKVVAGTLGSGVYTYTIEISLSTNFTGSGDSVICKLTKTEASALTGLEYLLIGQNSSSGRFAYLGINWGLLTLGTTYTASNYPEGALFCPVVASGSQFSGNGESDGLVFETDDGVDTTVMDGSYALYVFSLDTAGISAKLSAVSDCVGIVRVKTIPASGASALIIEPENNTVYINGVNNCSVEMVNTTETGDYAEFVPFNDGWIMINHTTDASIQSLA